MTVITVSIPIIDQSETTEADIAWGISSTGEWCASIYFDEPQVPIIPDAPYWE